MIKPYSIDEARRVFHSSTETIKEKKTGYQYAVGVISDSGRVQLWKPGSAFKSSISLEELATNFEHLGLFEGTPCGEDELPRIGFSTRPDGTVMLKVSDLISFLELSIKENKAFEASSTIGHIENDYKRVEQLIDQMESVNAVDQLYAIVLDKTPETSLIMKRSQINRYLRNNYVYVQKRHRIIQLMTDSSVLVRDVSSNNYYTISCEAAVKALNG